MEVKYNIGDSIEILPSKINGIVIGIYITFGQIQYQVRYFQGTDSKTTYFYEFELQDPTEKLLGFYIRKESNGTQY